MRGSGKSTIGKILAKKLNRLFLETDELIIKKHKMAIPRIVKNFGWEKFRDFEASIVAEIAVSNNNVVASGGGVVTREQNIRKLKKNGILIWLTANLVTLLKRIGADPNRPTLTSAKTKKEEMRLILVQRRKLYRKAADYIVATEGKTPHQVAKEILVLLREERFL